MIPEHLRCPESDYLTEATVKVLSIHRTVLEPALREGQHGRAWDTGLIAGVLRRSKNSHHSVAVLQNGEEEIAHRNLM